jgi:UDP:flavonoid glycosyltransferase YjiC (YdhE family)
LATQNPTVEQVRDGIEQVLEKPEFKNAALKLQEENAKMDAYSACERRVEALTI